MRQPVRHRFRDHIQACAGGHVRVLQPRDPGQQPALDLMFGYEPGALAGQSFSVLYPSPDEFERTGARIVPIMNACGRYSDERIMKRANQELFWCHVSGSGADPRRRACGRHLDLRRPQRQAAGNGRADAARARNSRTAGRGQDQQADRAPGRAQPAHGGDASGQADAQVRRGDLQRTGEPAAGRDAAGAFPGPGCAAGRSRAGLTEAMPAAAPRTWP